ncbi:ester cyclase [Gillisia sp. Q332]|uniref:ester cyclase n=1 Tax=Gillisia xinjiangensis TaxID=3384765 RepID=UPI003918A253
MSKCIHHKNKQLIQRFRDALYDCDIATLEAQLQTVFAKEAIIRLSFPFETLQDAKALFQTAYLPLLTAIPDLERRDFIFIAGSSEKCGNWVGCGGHYVGTFQQPWLDIPPTRHLVFMRYHEYFKIEDEKVVEMQAIWDIPQVMMQAKVWPMTPSLGLECVVPAPATQDGLSYEFKTAEHAKTSLKLVLDMLNGISRNKEGEEAMALDQYWHPKFNWYGPAGIGAMRGISGFRNWHQIPFLKAMPNRNTIKENTCFFAEGDYVAVTGWPNMQMVIEQDGWLGIAPSNQKITLRSLDFWRCENGVIRENWVLIDILSVYHQIGVDVFSRMKELI